MSNFFIDHSVIKQLNSFCEKFHKVYICGDEEYCRCLKKYLDMAEMAMSEILPLERAIALMSNTDINSGYILSCKSENISYCKFILQNSGRARNVFLLDAVVAYQIKKAMKPLTKNNFIVELVLADHCDLNCQMCDHFSPLAKNHCVSLAECERDVKRLSTLSSGEIGAIYLLGGEPLLNPELISIIKMIRKYFKDTQMSLYTNGIKLLEWEKHPSGNLWSVLRDNNVIVEITRYPIDLAYPLIVEKASEYKLQLNIFTHAGNRSDTNEKYSVKLKLDLNGRQEKFTFIQCRQRNHCHVLINGLMYTCPIIASVSHFNNYFAKKLVISEKDYINIYKAHNFEEIMTAMDVRPDFCRYCDLNHRTVHNWKVSNKNINEWI